MSYFINKKLKTDFNTAINKVTEQLQKEGFGVLSEINVQDTLKKKLDVNFKKYVILGACNPPNAYKALSADPHIGLMLPCNVVVQETDDGQIDISAIDPVASMQAVNNSEIKETAENIKSKLENVIKSI